MPRQYLEILLNMTLRISFVRLFHPFWTEWINLNAWGRGRRNSVPRNPAIVMAGLVPAIHVLLGMLARQRR